MDAGLGLSAAIGGLILAAVLLFAMLRNKQRTPREEARSEAATHKLYENIDAEDKRNEVAP